MEMTPVGRWRMTIVVASTLLTGCASIGPPFASLESAVVRDVYAPSPNAQNVRIVRGDSVLAPSVSMRLLKGDSISTSANTRVVVEFAAGYEVTLDTSTAIFIENPSIFLRIGQAFIRRIRGGLDTLTTNTPQAVLHDISTAYLVSVDARATSVRVAEGTVEAQSRDTRFPPARYQAFEHGEITNEGRWSRMGRMPPAELERQTSWVRLVERLSKIPVPRLDSMTEAQARAALQEVGLRTLLVMRRASGRFAPGLVIDHTPSAGERVAPGTFVNLVLEKEPSREQPANSCTVPEITGRTEAEGKRLLAASRLVGEATQRASREVDVITSQQEEAGTRVRCGSTVHYTWGRVG